VIIPKENEKDLREIPAHVKRDLSIVLVEHMDEVLARALALDDPTRFLHAGDHAIAEIYEVPPTETELPHPAGVN